MASDLTHLNFKVEFEKGTPFRPVDQLMAVLSPRSAHAIPSCLRPLMEDKNSPIIDFYPKDFVTDTEGKKFAWMGEVILPFIDEKRLLLAI
jgi:5'-3' exoribonuclease 2